MAGLLRDLDQRGLLDSTLVVFATEFGRMPMFQAGTFGREKVTTPHDFHATILHLLGLDHEALTVYHNGIERRLTDVHGSVIREVLV